MSHFTRVGTEIRDLVALKNALSSMGLELEHNVPCRYYYGSLTKENVVKLPGPYDMSLEKKDNGSYNISADLYGGHVASTIGTNGNILITHYSIEKLRIEARKMGYKVYSDDSSKNTWKLIMPGKSGKVQVQFDENGIASFKAYGFKGKECMVFENLEKAFGTIMSSERTAEYHSAVTQIERARVNL